MAEKNGNYQIVLSTRLDTTQIKKDLSKLEKLKININVQMSEKSLERLKELNNLLNETKALNNYTNGLKNIQATMQSYEKIASKVVTATNNLANSAKGAGNASKTAGEHVKSFGEKAMDAFQKFSLWSVVSGMFYKIVRAAEGLIDTAIELDTAFTELSKVTDLTRDDFDRLTQQAYELGSEVAKTTTEVVNAMTEFARAGYNVNESTDILAKNALMWTNIADGTVDASESANMMISVMKAFNVQAKDSTHIIDALNEVSNNYAVSSGQLSNSLTKSSAVLANANVTFEEQLGLITAGTEILRNANTVSNGLRTISLRLQGMEEDGEKVDGLTAKLEGDFNKLGLTLYETNGDLKDTYQILYELAPVYQTMSASQKAYYTELIAGKTRAQIAAAILNNFSTAINATETAYNSAGSAAKENAKVLESLNGHIQAFKAEWESLVNSKTTQDTLKFFIDLGTNIIKIIKDLGGLKTVLISTLAIFALIKGDSIISLGKTFVMLAHNIQYANSVTIGLQNTFSKTTLGVAKLGLAITALIAIYSALKNLVEYLDGAYDRQREEINKLNNEITENNNKLSKVNSQLEENNKKIIEINKHPLDIINKNTLDTLKQENKELLAQKALLEEIVDEKNKLAGEATQKSLTTTRVNDELFKETGISDERGGYSEFRGSFHGKYTFLEETQLLLNRKKEILEALNNGEFSKSDWEFQLTGVKTSEQLNQELSNTNNLLAEHMAQLDEDSSKLSKNNSEQKETIDVINGLVDQYLKMDVLSNDFNEFDEIFKKATDENKQKMKELIDEGNFTVKSFEEYFPRLTVWFNAIGLSTQDVVDKITNLLQKTDEVANDTSVEEKLSNVYVEVENVSSKYKDLSNAVTEYNNNGKLSVETMSNLLQKYPDYLAVLETEGYSIEVVNNLLKNEIQLKINEARQENESALQAKFGTDVKYEEIKARVENARAIYEEVKALQALHGGIYGPDNTEQLLKDQETALAEYEETEKKLSLLEKSLLNGFGSGGGSGGSKKNTTDEWKQAFTKAYNDLKNRRDRDLIDTETYYKELKELNDKYFKDREQYVEEYTKYELELYKGIKEVFKEQIDDMQHAITMLENQGADKEIIIAKYKEIQDKLHEQAEYYRGLNLAGNQDEIDELSEQWWQYQKNIEKLQKEITDDLKEQLDKQIDELTKRFEALRDVALDTIEKQIDEKQNWLEEQNDLLDEQIDKYKDQKDTMEDEKEIQEKLLKIEEARKKLAEAKNKKVRVYREGKGFVYETDFDAVNEAQEQLNDLLEDWQLFQEKARIQDIVEQLEAEKQANKDRVNKEIEDLNRLKDAWDKSLDLAQDVENYKNWLTKIENSENDSFNSRLNLVKEFVNSYNAEMKQLQTQYPTETKTTTSTGGSGSGGSGGVVVKKYNGISYNPNVDYQQKINEAKAAGAPADHLVSLEKQRNAKIAGEGITNYSPTYNYTSPSGYASGTERADGLLHVVGENGPELYVPPEGSGILPNNVTSNLMNWGTINPMQLVKNLASNSGTVINVDNISLPNVKDGDSFVNELKNFKSFAIQRESNRK